MTPQAARFVEKAQKLLADAEIMLGAGLNDAAGRNAYLAGFHAAQAFIFEHVGKTFKSHSGVQKEFLRLTKDDPRMPVISGPSCRAPIISNRSPITRPGLAPKSLVNAPATRLPAASGL